MNNGLEDQSDTENTFIKTIKILQKNDTKCEKCSENVAFDDFFDFLVKKLFDFRK